MKRTLFSFLGFSAGFLVFLIIFAGTNSSQNDSAMNDRILELEATIHQLEATLEETKPGLGGLMLGIQQHHTKLYYSGQASNWDLAQFNVHEIEEAFEDIEKWHAKHDGIALDKLAHKHLSPALHSVEDAIAAGDQVHFSNAFATLTAACNNCHNEAEHAFIKIQPPTSGDFTNQVFSN